MHIVKDYHASPHSPLPATYIFSLPNLLQLVSLLFLQAFMPPSLRPSVA